MNGPYRISKSNHLLCYVSSAWAATDYKDIATAVHIGFAIEDRVEYLSNRRRGFPNLLSLELRFIWIVIMPSCDNEMIESGVSGVIVCMIQCGELPVTRDFVTLPVSCQNFVA
jgi:hypothetical protein